MEKQFGLKRVAKFLSVCLIVISISACTDYSKEENYSAKINSAFENYKVKKSVLLHKAIQAKSTTGIIDSYTDKSLSSLEKQFENQLNSINRNFSHGKNMRPYSFKAIEKTYITEFKYSLPFKIVAKHIIALSLSSILNYLLRFIVLSIFVTIIFLIVDYCLPIQLFKVLFSHRYVWIFFATLTFFISPADFIGITTTHFERKTNSLVEINLEMVEKTIDNTKQLNESLIR